MRIFYDVDTQNDFMNTDGALYVGGAEDSTKAALEEMAKAGVVFTTTKNIISG